MEFYKFKIKKEIEINHLFSFHYFEYASNYLFDGERHNFWELLYVDRGSIEVISEATGYILVQGDIIFHKPNEFHSVWANTDTAPNAVVIAFECKSRAIDFFEGKIFKLTNIEKNILSNIVIEGVNTFRSPLDNPNINLLKTKSGSRFGSEQMIKIKLEELLIILRRRNSENENKLRLSPPTKIKGEQDLVSKAKLFFQENISQNITLSELCNHMNMSKSHVLTLFRNYAEMGAIEYFKHMKIENAKVLIREGNHNLTEISEILGYSSVHSFSRHFKMVIGVSPTEYSKSIKLNLSL